MPTVTDKAAFVRKEYRYETQSDVSVKTEFPQAIMLELPTNLNSTSASGLALTILNATKTHALAWEVEVDGVLMLEDFDGTVPHYTLDFPLFETDSRTYKVVGCEIDYVANITTLRLRG